MLESYVRLLDIDGIIEENIDLNPGTYLAKYGIYVFATTVGGHGLCVDTNDVKDGDASILIADYNFCYYNERYNCIAIRIAPKEIIDDHLREYKKNPDCGPKRLNYYNIKRCLPKIEGSFFEFMRKLSMNEYEDIEEYLL